MNLSPRRRLVLLVAVWAALLVALAFVWPDGEPTVREQVPVGDSRAEIAAAVEAAVTAASGYDDAVFTVGAFEKEADCSLTPVRAGIAYEQVVRLYARPENARSVLTRMYDALHTAYDLVGNGDGAYLGYTGPFVTAELSLADDGAVTWRLDTGCRPVDEPVAQLEGVGSPSPEAEGIAGAVGLTGARWGRVAAVCAVTVSTSAVAGLDAVTRAGEGGWVSYSGPSGAPTWFVGAAADGSATVLAWDGEDGVARVSATSGCV